MKLRYYNFGTDKQRNGTEEVAQKQIDADMSTISLKREWIIQHMMLETLGCQMKKTKYKRIFILFYEKYNPDGINIQFKRTVICPQGKKSF